MVKYRGLFTVTKMRDGQLIHIEAPGCVVNIMAKLVNMGGQEVTAVEILPDRFVGEEWDLDSGGTAANVRVIRRDQGV